MHHRVQRARNVIYVLSSTFEEFRVQEGDPRGTAVGGGGELCGRPASNSFQPAEHTPCCLHKAKNSAEFWDETDEF